MYLQKQSFYYTVDIFGFTVKPCIGQHCFLGARCLHEAMWKQFSYGGGKVPISEWVDQTGFS